MPHVQRKLFTNMGMRIQSPGNQCLGYQESEMIGKFSMRVTATSVWITNVGPDCAVFIAFAAKLVSGTIKTLSPKWIDATDKKTTNFFISSTTLFAVQVLKIQYRALSQAVDRRSTEKPLR